VVSADGVFELAAAAGNAAGARRDLPLGPGGAFVIYGDRADARAESVLTSVGRLIRRRLADERLEQAAIVLARRNQALEDFAALVAHELKSPLRAALLAPDPSRLVGDALDLVDTLLVSARDERPGGAEAWVPGCLDDIVGDFGGAAEVRSDAAVTLPIPAAPLRVILRNLLANALAAHARHVHVVAEQMPDGWELRVDDDGVGLADAGDYASGSGLGLSLCRRLAGRFGAVLELAPGPCGGTRARLRFTDRLA
jgi:signal transduction histidine kinase